MRFQAAALASLASLIAAAPSRGGVISAAWGGETSFVYEISNMPDLDQERCGSESLGGLPNCGQMYCVPTSIMNLFAYAANHGFPELPPGPGNWRLDSKYVTASDHIRLFGTMCSTDPFDGTYHGPASFATLIWLAQSGKLVVDEATSDGDWAPTINTLASKAVGGAIVAFCYGRYEIAADLGGSIMVGDRLGGHCVTLRKAARSGSNMLIESRDPGDDSGSFVSQSEFGSQLYTARNHVVFNSAFSFSRTMTSLNHPVGDGVVRLVDSYFAIRPKASYSWAPFSPPKIKITTPEPLDPIYAPDQVIELGSPLGHLLIDAAMTLDATQVAIVTQSPAGPSSLGVASLVDDSYVEIGASEPRARVVVGRRGQLYQLRATTLQCYDVTLKDPLVATLELPALGTDIAYDDARDEVVVYSPSIRTIYVCPENLADFERVILPASVPLAGDGEITVGPGSGLWVHPEGVSAIFKATVPDGGGAPDIEMLSHVSLNGVGGFDVDDAERVFACVDGVLREYSYDEVLLRWGPATDSPSGLDGTSCDGELFVARSRTNFDPATMTGPAWRNIPPSELVHKTFIADCIADIDGDGVVGITDLLTVLTQWGPCADCSGDLDGNGSVGVTDLLAILVAWGPCP